MSRVLRTESATRTRELLLQAVAVALRGLVASSISEAQLRDRLAFTALALDQIALSANQTCAAWEKRGYWVKADRFRAEWNWLDQPRLELGRALDAGDLTRAAGLAAGLLVRLAGVHIPVRLRQTHPWEGAWSTWCDRPGRGRS